jgi:subtilisin
MADDEIIRPAWSHQFAPDAIRALESIGPLGSVTREWAWGQSTGKGVRIAVVDSGIEQNHEALEGCVRGGVIIEIDDESEEGFKVIDEHQPIDLVGHGTACAGIIHSIAPEAELFSVRVLGRGAKGRALQFAGGLEWALANNMQVCNLSLSTSSEEYYGYFHTLADEAYFNRMMLVSAVNNIPAPSYPSLYSSVISVAAHEGKDPFTYYYNPDPPVEFGAPGIDVKVAWINNSYMISTGNSFATPHISGLVALIIAKHPNLTPFQIKTILYACANNSHFTEDAEGEEEKK